MGVHKCYHLHPHGKFHAQLSQHLGIDCSLVEWNVLCDNNGHDITTLDNETLMRLQYVLGFDLVGCSCTESMLAHHVVDLVLLFLGIPRFHISALPLVFLSMQT